MRMCWIAESVTMAIEFLRNYISNLGTKPDYSYSVSQKNLPYGFSKFFPSQTVENF